MILSVAALAQNGSANAMDSRSPSPAGQTMTKSHAQPERQQAARSGDCGNGLGQLLKELTSPPNPFGSACDLQEQW